MQKIRIKWCKLAEDEHEWEKRFYCHTFHKENTICACRDFLHCNLHPQYFWGILLHEVGHLLAGKNANEKDANKAVLKHFRIRIRYEKETPWGDNLEYISDSKIEEARRQTQILIIF